ncbi:hypothetical protein [Mycolicibacterium obuense]|uniref:hypothetical protein n=1 Tax=Mycolicibacterium obuense TaxID=1807 RepID=UPI0039B7717E
MSRTATPSSATACQDVPAGADSNASRNNAAAGGLGEEPGEPAFAVGVRRAGHPDRTGADPVESEQREDRATPLADHTVGGRRVGLDGRTARHPGCARRSDDRPVGPLHFGAQGL